MAWTQRISVNAQQRNAGTFNTGNFTIPAIVDELRADFSFPNQLLNVVSGSLRVQFSINGGTSWLPQNVFSWELSDKIGTIDKNGVTVTTNPLLSFIIPVPDAVKGALMRARITLNNSQFIGLTVYTQ